MAGMDAMMAAVVPPTDDEFRAFLTQVHDDVEIEDFVQIVGNDLLGAKVLSPADFGTPPNPLQVAKLTRRMRGSGIVIADIETGAEWKDKQLAESDEAEAVRMATMLEAEFEKTDGAALGLSRADAWAGLVCV